MVHDMNVRNIPVKHYIPDERLHPHAKRKIIAA